MVFLAPDLVWLSLVAQGLDEHFLGDLLADSPNAVAAFVCDPLFVPGLVYFDIAPAVDEQSVRAAFVRGAAFGLVTYATWDVTSLAVIEGFPVGIVPIDMAWAASSRRRSARRRTWCCAASPSVVRDVLESGRTSGRAV